ncbi:hypothetical protein PLICRDRAFT_179212 [Plicaturopsis crispa FD-325 SS-3]|uniref:Protein kinase domain-containing protein n=1 Tax=Plicaturopsis crispa FD-325 SS-3 TaxID=944288 RepID=A0A0C9T6B8_PLICR|nr:hypothetical protein PLICRDRAFT_179212 [Plicaturopsis crispa FD-325 SS-3]
MAASHTPFAFLNSVAKVTLDGVARGSDGRNVSLELQRRTPPPVVPKIDTWRPREGGPPARLPSLLPAPGDLSLTLSVGDEIVFAFPALVIKIATRFRSKDLAKEAWFYEEMECLQGVGLARCYGFFQAELEDNIHIGLWDNDEGDEDDEGVTEAERLGDHPPRVLSILLLERRGDRMPFGEPTPAGAKEDMADIYHDMAELGIYHRDIRWQNFLRAPSSSTGLPSLPSPYTNRAYGWRVIDFDNSEKNNSSMIDHKFYYNSFMRRIFRSIPCGFIVEPWE